MSEVNDTDIAELLQTNGGEVPGRRALPKGVSSQRVAPLIINQYADSRGSLLLRNLYDLYTSLPTPARGLISTSIKKQMRLDPCIYLGMTMLKAPILTVNWWVDGETSASKEAAALCNEVLSWHYRTISRLSMRCLDFGWQCFKVLWGFRDVQVTNETLGVDKMFKSALVPVKFIDFDPEEIYPLVDPTTREFIGIELSQSFLSSLPARPRIPRETLFVVANDPEYGDPRGRSLYDNVYKAWWASELVQFMSLRYFERKGDPPLVGRGPSNQIVEDPDTHERLNAMDHMLAKLAELRQGNQVVLPSDWDEFAKQYLYSVDILKDDQRGEMFSDFTDFLDHRKLMGLGIPPKVLLTGNKVGTYAETKEQGGTFNVAVQALMENMWIESVNAQLIGPITTLNFPPDTKQPEFKTDSFTKSDLALEREVIKGFFEAKRKVRGSGGEVKGEGTGYQLVDIKRLMASHGWPMIDTDQFEEVQQPADVAAQAKVDAANKPPGSSGKTSGPSGQKVLNTLTE